MLKTMLLSMGLFVLMMPSFAEPLRTGQLAATCLSCHPVAAKEGSAIISLFGRSYETNRQALLDYRSGVRSGKLMNQISQGLSYRQIERLSDYFSQKP